MANQLATLPVDDGIIDVEFRVECIDYRECSLCWAIVKADCLAAGRRVAEVWRQYVSILQSFFLGV